MNDKERQAALLALGLLWMVNNHTQKTGAAYDALLQAFGKDGLRQGIKLAIDSGHEADHPTGADYWAGKKDNDSEKEKS